MARTRKSKAQAEIPGTESPDRIPELHVLGLEIKDLEQQRLEIGRQEVKKRQMAVAQLTAHHLEKYDVDGVHIWEEDKGKKLKVKIDGDPKNPEDGE